MTRRILLLDAHPDRGGAHFCDRLADAYAQGAQEGGHALRRIDLASLDFPLLRSQHEFEHGATPEPIRAAQQDLLWADHFVLVHPLWLGMAPALLKAFLEQVLRPDFVQTQTPAARTQRTLRGKSARVVVTMGMPAFAYRWFFGAHGVKALQRSVLRFCGFAPVRRTLIGSIEAPDSRARHAALARLHALGRAGA